MLSLYNKPCVEDIDQHIWLASVIYILVKINHKSCVTEEQIVGYFLIPGTRNTKCSSCFFFFFFFVFKGLDTTFVVDETTIILRTFEAANYNYPHAYHWDRIWGMTLFTRKQKSSLLHILPPPPLPHINQGWGIRQGFWKQDSDQHCIEGEGRFFFQNRITWIRCIKLFFIKKDSPQ